MLLALGTAEKNSGLVTQPCMSVTQTSMSALFVTVPTHSNQGREMDEEETALVVDSEFQLLSGKYFKFSGSLKIKIWSRESQQPGLKNELSLKSFTELFMKSSLLIPLTASVLVPQG